MLDIDIINSKYPTRVDIVNEAIRYYLKGTKSKEITNFNEGSIARIILDVVALDAGRKYAVLTKLLGNCIPQLAINEYLDYQGEYVGIIRWEATPSKGIVTVYPPINYEPFTMPKGTKINSRDGFVYMTKKSISFTGIEPSIDVEVVSLNAGSIYNITKGNEFNMSFPHRKITNSLDFSGGSDKEEDDSYRNRILKWRNNYNFGTISFYIKHTIQLDGVTDCAVKVIPVVKQIFVYSKEEDDMVETDVWCNEVNLFVNSNEYQVIHYIDYFYNQPGSPNRVAGTCVKVNSAQPISLEYNTTNPVHDDCYLAVYYVDDGKFIDDDDPLISNLKKNIYAFLIEKIVGLKINESLYLKDLNKVFDDLGIEGYCVLNYYQDTPMSEDPTTGPSSYKLGTIDPPYEVNPLFINKERGYDFSYINVPRIDKLVWINIITGHRYTPV